MICFGANKILLCGFEAFHPGAGTVYHRIWSPLPDLNEQPQLLHVYRGQRIAVFTSIRRRAAVGPLTADVAVDSERDGNGGIGACSCTTTSKLLATFERRLEAEADETF